MNQPNGSDPTSPRTKTAPDPARRDLSRRQRCEAAFLQRPVRDLSCPMDSTPSALQPAGKARAREGKIFPGQCDRCDTDARVAASSMIDRRTASVAAKEKRH